MSDVHILTRAAICMAAIAAFSVTGAAAVQAQSGLSKGVSRSAQQNLVAATEQRLDRERAKQLARTQAAATRLARSLAPHQKEWQRAFQADRRSNTFQRDLQAAAKRIAAARTAGQRRAAVDAQANVYGRHKDLLRDVRQNAPTTDTAQLRNELARSLGVRPSDLGGDRDVVFHDARSADRSRGRSRRTGDRRAEAPPPSQLTLEPPFSYTSSDHEDLEPLSGGMAYGYTMSGAFDEFPAQALSWSTAGTGSLGGIATTSGWGRVGDTFSVPAGFTRLRVEARVELHNDPVAIFVFGFGTGSITETISLAVIGPDGLFEYGTLTLTDLSFSGVAPPSLPSPPGGSLAASSGLEIPVALEFDIPAVGGDFSVSLGVDTMVSAGGLGGATSVDNGNLTAQVIAFEVEALE